MDAPQLGAAGFAGSGGAPQAGAGSPAAGDPAGGPAGAGGVPQVGAGAAPGVAAGALHPGAAAPGVPHVAWPDFAGLAAGWSQLGDDDGGTTTVGATGTDGMLGFAVAGGAHVEATLAVWLTGDAGRTGGADFLCLRLRRVLR